VIIDLNKLVNLKQDATGWQAQCPACAAEGRDLAGKNHLHILKDGKFNCVVDESHTKIIFKLVGIDSDGEVSNFTQEVEQKVEMPKRWPLSTLDRLIKNYDYWINRGIDAETVEKFGGGIATRGSFTNRWVLPIYNKEKTEIVGFTGRSITNQKPPWMHNGKKSEWIWSPDINCIKQKGYILIVESPACVLKLASLKRWNSLCLFGTTISDAQISHLISICPDKIFIGTNNEPGNGNIGNFAAEKIQKKLLKFFNEDKIKITLPCGAKDFAEKNHNWEEWSKKYEQY
jgi:hypothetical protein